MRLGSEPLPREPGRRAHALPAPRWPPDSWKPGREAARRALTRARRHQGQDPGARGVRSGLRAAGAGEVWSACKARSRTPGSGGPGRPGVLPVRPESPEPSLSLAAPKDRPGYGVSHGHREREHLAEPASDVGPQPGTWLPPPAQETQASGEAQTYRPAPQ